MPGFNLGFNQRNFNGTKATSTAAVNMGAMRGKGSTSRMLNFCKTHSTNPSGCINQFVNIAPAAPAAPPPPPNTTILVYSASQGSSFVWSGVTYTLNTSLPNYSYTAITSSIPATQLPQARTVLTGVTIGNSVTSIGANAFSGCSNLTSVTFTPTSTLTTIGNTAFQSCGLLAIEIPNSVININYRAFLNCLNMTSVIFAPTSQVTTIGVQAFAVSPGSSGALASIIIPDTVTSIDGTAFQNSGLTTVYISAATAAILTVTVPSASTSFFGATVQTIMSYTFTGTGTLAQSTVTNNIGAATYIIIQDYTSIGDSAFVNNTLITSVTIPNSVLTIGNNAFQSCTNLASVTIGNSVTSIGISAFQACTILASAVTIPASVTSIGISAFQGCFGLTSINVDTSNTSYSSIDGVLFNKAGTTLVEFPPGKSTSYIIPNSVTIIGENAFIDVNGLTSVTIGNSVTTIGNNAFQSCNGLTTVTFTSNLTLTTIGDQAFRTCPNLTSISIPTSVTSIGISAFQGCSKFTSIVIPALVNSIGGSAFQSCTLLTTVYIGLNPQTISGTPYSGGQTVNFFGKTVNIVYPPP